MRVLVVGATGVVGRPLVRTLVRDGHEVVASARRAPGSAATGARFEVLDLLDRADVARVVRLVRPHAIVHQATALKALGNNLRRFDADFRTTNRLRTEGTRALIMAADELDTPPRLIVQSFCGWTWAPTGGPVKTEEDAVDPRPAPAFRQAFAALMQLEDLVARYPEGVALRYGTLYGPATSLTEGGAQIEAIRERRFPLVGPATGIWSFLHVDDAADAAAAALEAGRGIYNVVDDAPVAVAEFLPELAEMCSAPPPRHVPVWSARLAGGRGLVHMMVTARGSSNAKAKRDLGWAPGRASWRDGFAKDLRSCRGSA